MFESNHLPNGMTKRELIAAGEIEPQQTEKVEKELTIEITTLNAFGKLVTENLTLPTLQNWNNRVWEVNKKYYSDEALESILVELSTNNEFNGKLTWYDVETNDVYDLNWK